MANNIKEIAERLHGLREVLEFSEEAMAQAAGVSVEEYRAYEAGERDFSVTFLQLCAEKCGVDVVELLTGNVPRLKSYSVVRKGTGVTVHRRESFSYQHLAHNFSGKMVEPFYVQIPYKEELEHQPIAMSMHDGQEFDYILSGQLKIVVDGKEKVLLAGDAIYYDSSKPHGLIAVGGTECVILAVVIPER